MAGGLTVDAAVVSRTRMGRRHCHLWCAQSPRCHLWCDCMLNFLAFPVEDDRAAKRCRSGSRSRSGLAQAWYSLPVAVLDTCTHARCLPGALMKDCTPAATDDTGYVWVQRRAGVEACTSAARECSRAGMWGKLGRPHSCGSCSASRWLVTSGKCFLISRLFPLWVGGEGAP